MKKIRLIILLVIVLITACKKDKIDEVPATVDTDVYNSLADFYEKNGVKSEIVKCEGDRGTYFSTPSGTTVETQANCFIDKFGNTVVGQVNIEFKDINTKSEMLLSNMPPALNWKPTGTNSGRLMSSAGEFNIKVTQNNEPLTLKPNTFITIKKPFKGKPVDSAMKPYVLIPDSIPGSGNGTGWTLSPNDTIILDSIQYVYNFFRFFPPLNTGTWANCDNPYFFYNCTFTTIKMKSIDSLDVYNSNVFLVYKDLNAMVCLYNINGYYTYNYAPVGLRCTLVALTIKDKKLHAAFVDVERLNNPIQSFKLAKMSTAEFKARLKLLDN